MLPVHLQPESHVPLYVQLRDQLRALVHAGDLRPGDRIPASRELATMLGVHRTTVANAYAELESEGLIQGHVGRGTFIRGNGNGLKITPPAPPVLNGSNGIRWELLFADERSDEILSRLTASAPEDALSFVMARPAQEYFPVEELLTCVSAVLKREAHDVLNLGPSDGYGPLKEALIELDNAITNGADMAEIHSARGHLQFELEMYDEAVQSYQRLAVLDNTHPNGAFNLAVCLEKGAVSLRELASGRSRRFECKDLRRPELFEYVLCACSPGGVSNRTSKRRSRSGRVSCTARLTAV